MNKAEKRRQKDKCKKRVLAALRKAGIEFTTKNNVHYFIATNEGRIDFWPTTGKFWVVGTKIKGTQVKDLIYEVSVRNKNKPAKTPLAKPSFNRVLSKASTDARHRQRKIMAHFGMNFD